MFFYSEIINDADSKYKTYYEITNEGIKLILNWIVTLQNINKM